MEKTKKITGIFVGMLVISAIILGLPSLITNSAQAGGGCGGGGCGGGGGGGGSQDPLSEYEIQALLQSIDEEYYAKAVYQKVIDTFGNIQPFPKIRNQEQCHINMVKNLLINYDIPVPPDQWIGNIPLEFLTKQYACEVGAQAEFDNAATYDILLDGVDNNDIITVFIHLGDVSRYNHLPSFLYWADYYQSIGE